MKLILTRNLSEGSILAKDIFDAYGDVLLKAGTKLTSQYINTLKKSGVFYVFVEYQDDVQIKQDEKLNKLKQTMIDVMPDLFNNLLDGDKESVFKEVNMVNELVDHIIEKGDITTSLYDIKEYDDYTYAHCVNTCIMSTFLGMELNMSANELRVLATGAILHDIGKTKVPIMLLNKKEKLTDSEFAEIKKHSIYGYDILSNAGISDRTILSVVLEHHERIDGKGYPLRIGGERISPYSKIVSLSDVFTALTANRSYRPRFNPADAYEYILGGMNSLFEPSVVEMFKDKFAIYPYGTAVALSNGKFGVVIGQNKGFPDRPIIKVTESDELKDKTFTYDIDLLQHHNITIIDPVA